MNKIINFYEVMPKKFLVGARNPNFDLHGFKIPFRMIIAAPGGSGKTTFLVNLIRLFSTGEGTFETIHIITRDKDEPLYNWLSEVSNYSIIISDDLSKIPDLSDFDKSENHLVVFDDLVLADKNIMKMIEEYYMRCRKKNVSVVFISQSYFDTSKFIRKNCNYIVVLRLGGKREVQTLLRDFSLGVTNDQLLKMYKYATDEKFSPFIIDVDSGDDDKKFRKGFGEYLDPSKFNNLVHRLSFR